MAMFASDRAGRIFPYYSRRFAYVRSRFVLPTVLPLVSQIRQARHITASSCEHKTQTQSVCVLWSRLPDLFRCKTLDNVYLYVFVYVRSIDKTAAVLLYLYI